MNIKMLQVICVAAGLFVPVTLAVSGASEPSAAAQNHSPGLIARVTMPDGATRTVRLDGVGCSVSICSRTAIKAKMRGGSLVSTLFDNLAAIRDTSEDGAVFVMKDGGEHQRTLLKDFRVLYLASPSGETEKLDLAKVKSVEFLAQQR